MRPGRAFVAAVVGLAIVLGATSAQAITLSSPLQAGDLFGVQHSGSYLYQIRGGALMSSVGLTKAGGVATDADSNLWVCHGDGSAGNPLTIETVAFGTTASVPKIAGATLNAPAGSTSIRDVILDSAGNLYAAFETTGTVMKYTPDGSGGFNTGAAVATFAAGGTDNGSWRLSLSADEAYLVTGARWAARAYSMRLSDGTVQSSNPGSTMASQVQVDQLRPDAILYSQDDGLRQVAFNPATGAVGTSSIALSFESRSTDDFCDGLTYAAPLERLYFSTRAQGGEIRYATEQQLADAAAGTPFDVASLPLVYNGGAASVMRDMSVIAPAAPQITLNSPLAPGDVLTLDADLRRLYQIRGGTAVSVIDFGGLTTVGGVFVDGSNSLYITSGSAGKGSVDRIAFGDTTSTQVLRADELLGSTPVRDSVVAADGTVYVSMGDGTGSIVKFAPGPTGYSRTDLGTFGLNLQSDRGNGHLDITPDGGYLVTATRSSNRIASMDTITGAVQTWAPTSGMLALIGEGALSPDADFVVFGAGSGAPAYLYGLDFNSATGGFGSAATLLNTDANLWIDALGFDPLSGSLYLCARDSKMYVASADVVAAAMGGSPFTVRDLPVWYQGSGVSVARDFAIVTPEPATMLLLGGGLLALARRRRQGRKTA